MAKLPSSVHRNRIIYQSEALFVSPDATGYHYTGKNGVGTLTPVKEPENEAEAFNENGQLMGWSPAGGGADTLTALSSNSADRSIIKQLKRVQSINYGFSVNYTDVNQFGNMSRLDTVVLETPTVNLDFSYYLLDGYNERHLEFITDGKTSALSGHLTPSYYQAGNNFFILTTAEGVDAVNGDSAMDRASDNNQKSVISVGNGYVTDYSVDISVGAIPTASVTVEGMNIKSEIGTSGLDVPSIDMFDGSWVSNAWKYNDEGTIVGTNVDPTSSDAKEKVVDCINLYTLPYANSGYTGCEDVAALRPGDIIIDLQGKSLLSHSVSGGAEDNINTRSTQKGAAAIQSASISLGMGRSTLERIGSTFGFSKALDVPVNGTLSVSAIASDIKQGNLTDLLCECETLDVTITMLAPECTACVQKTGEPIMRYTLKEAKLTSENFSSSIGDNKTVDLEFSFQVGGADDTSRGLFISGVEGNPNSDSATPKPGSNFTKGGADVWGLPPGFCGVNAAGVRQDYEYNIPGTAYTPKTTTGADKGSFTGTFVLARVTDAGAAINSSSVTITAVDDGNTAVTLTGDGESTLSQLIADHNTLGVSDLTLASGSDGSQIPGNGVEIDIAAGTAGNTVNLSTTNLEDVVDWATGTGYANGVYVKHDSKVYVNVIAITASSAASSVEPDESDSWEYVRPVRTPQVLKYRK
jgi:hypothetical protein